MQQPGKWDKQKTIAAWADITLKLWQAKLTDLKVWETGELYNSLQNELFKAAGNDVDKVEFAFNLYGVFVDMGVGREIYIGNPGDVNTTRKRKKWYSGIFYREVMKLGEIMAEKYGQEAKWTIIDAMKPVDDLKYAHAKGEINI
jgi:hypothetical protein